jgi:acetylornithine deacetylase/succinyl-diaminopimelate desuccinylase-like protein
MDLPITTKVVGAVKAARGNIVEWPTMGGSLPLKAIEHATSARTITVPIANYDNNQHAANENIRLQNLWDGIETVASLLSMQ